MCVPMYSVSKHTREASARHGAGGGGGVEERSPVCSQSGGRRRGDERKNTSVCVCVFNRSTELLASTICYIRDGGELKG